MTRPAPLAAPAPLEAGHDITDFDCGEPALDDWLKRRALKNQAAGASRCFVIAEGRRVIGFYSLSAGALGLAEGPNRLRRNMPDPLPVLLLGRLAVDRCWQGRGLGQALLRDALLRALAVSAEAGIVAVLVHALTDAARNFYLGQGFAESPVRPMTLMVTLATVREIVAEGR